MIARRRNQEQQDPQDHARSDDSEIYPGRVRWNISRVERETRNNAHGVNYRIKQSARMFQPSIGDSPCALIYAEVTLRHCHDPFNRSGVQGIHRGGEIPISRSIGTSVARVTRWLSVWNRADRNCRSNLNGAKWNYAVNFRLEECSANRGGYTRRIDM